jgi:hypothetical protein
VFCHNTVRYLIDFSVSIASPKREAGEELRCKADATCPKQLSVDLLHIGDRRGAGIPEGRSRAEWESAHETEKLM